MSNSVRHIAARTLDELLSQSYKDVLYVIFYMNEPPAVIIDTFGTLDECAELVWMDVRDCQEFVSWLSKWKIPLAVSFCSWPVAIAYDVDGIAEMIRKTRSFFPGLAT